MKRNYILIAFLFILMLTSCTKPAEQKAADSFAYSITLLGFDEDIVKGTVEYEVVKTADVNGGILFDFNLKNSDIDTSLYNLEGRLNLGYFYLWDDKAWKIEETSENYEALKKGEIPTGSVLIWQSDDLKDSLKEDEKGVHESIKANGDSCEYSSYNNNVESGYYENIVWSKSKGLVSFKSGYGAERDAIELNLHDNVG